MAQITVSNLSLGYEGKNVVENINFQVNKGDYLCIVGENGSGKSTLIKALIGAKKAYIGEIKTGDGFSVNEIGYLPQRVEKKDFPATVFEVIMSGFAKKIGLRPFYNKTEKNKATEIMKRLDIANLAKAPFSELSGGQMQRVFLARALCATQKMLLLDEPDTGLDPIASAEMYEMISKLNKDERISVIMVSHDIPSAIKYSTHILHLSKEPLFFGKTDDYVSSKIGGAFLDGGDVQ